MSQIVQKPQWAPLPHLEIARDLYGLLMDGAPPAGFHLQRGPCLRDARTRRPLPSSYTDEWRPARQVHEDGTHTDRLLSAHTLAQHLAGKYDVAWQLPSWTSIFVFDIDRPVVAARCGESEEQRFCREIEADRLRDEVLARVWRLFDLGRERLPVILSTPGGGYHLYFAIDRGAGQRERTWPAGWLRDRVEEKLCEGGLALRPGTLELFPAGTRLRAPCGARTALLDVTRPEDPDDLGLRAIHCRKAARRRGDRIERVRVRSVRPMVEAFVSRLEAGRRSLAEWLCDDRARWHEETGPFGARSAARSPRAGASLSSARNRVTQDNVDVVGREAAASSGALLFGKAFVDRIAELSAEGLSAPGQRHDAALKLAWYWGVCLGLDWDAVALRLRRWLLSFSHRSATREGSDRSFVSCSLREARHYYFRHVVARMRGRGVGFVDLAALPLPAGDAAVLLPRIASSCRREADRILRFLYAQADASGCLRGAVALSSRILGLLCGDRRIRERDSAGVLRRPRATTRAVGELCRLGVLCLHTDYSTGRHGRLYRSDYVFGSARIPRQPARVRSRLEFRAVEEGTLQLVSSGPRAGWSLAPGERVDAGGIPWWKKRFERRYGTLRGPPEAPS